MGHEPRVGALGLAIPAGKRLGSGKKSLSGLLERAGVPTERLGARRTGFFSRHFQISRQPIAGAGALLLATSTGTSGGTIRRFCGQQGSG